MSSTTNANFFITVSFLKIIFFLQFFHFKKLQIKYFSHFFSHSIIFITFNNFYIRKFFQQPLNLPRLKSQGSKIFKNIQKFSKKFDSATTTLILLGVFSSPLLYRTLKSTTLLFLNMFNAPLQSAFN